MKRRMLVGITFSLLLFSVNCFCQTSYIEGYVAGGMAFPHLSNYTSIPINEYIINHYQTHKKYQTEPLVGLGVGYSYIDLFNLPLQLRMALMGYYVNLGNIQGIEYPYVNGGDFDTLNYRFKAESETLLFEPKLLYTAYYWQPYIFFGVGAARNRLYSYNEVPTDPAGSAAPVPFMFENRIVNTYSYEAGLGMQYQISNYHNDELTITYFLSLDYRYLNLGKGKLGNFPAKTAGRSFEVSHLATQAVVLSLVAQFV